MELVGKVCLSNAKECQVEKLKTVVKLCVNLLDGKSFICVTKSGHLVKYVDDKITNLAKIAESSDVARFTEIDIIQDTRENVVLHDDQDVLRVYRGDDEKKSFELIWKTQEDRRVEEYFIDDFHKVGHEQILVKYQGLGRDNYEIKDFAPKETTVKFDNEPSASVVEALSRQKVRARESVENVEAKIEKLTKALDIALASLSGDGNVIQESKLVVNLFGQDRFQNLQDLNLEQSRRPIELSAKAVGYKLKSGSAIVIYKIGNRTPNVVAKDLQLFVDLEGKSRGPVEIKKSTRNSLREVYESLLVEETMSKLFDVESSDDSSLTPTLATGTSIQFIVQVEKYCDFQVFKSSMEFQVESGDRRWTQNLPEVKFENLKDLETPEEITLRTMTWQRKSLRIDSKLEIDFDLKSMIVNNLKMSETENILHDDSLVVVLFPRNKFDWRVEVFYETVASLKSFVKNLYDFLGDDILITVAKQNESKDLEDREARSRTKAQIAALQREMFLLTSKRISEPVLRSAQLETDRLFLSQ